MPRPRPSDPVHFGKIILSWDSLALITDDQKKAWLRRQILSLTPSEIAHGLTHPNGKGLLERACELSALDYREITHV